MADFDDSIIGTVAGVEQKNGKAKFKIDTGDGRMRTVNCWIEKKDGGRTQAYSLLAPCVERPRQVVAVHGNYYEGEFQGKSYKSFNALFVELLDERPATNGGGSGGVTGEGARPAATPNPSREDRTHVIESSWALGLAIQLKANQSVFKTDSAESKLARLPLGEIAYQLIQERDELVGRLTTPTPQVAVETVEAAFPEDAF